MKHAKHWTIGSVVAFALLLAGVRGSVEAGSADMGAGTSVGVGADVGGVNDSTTGAAADAKNKADAARQAPNEMKKAAKQQADEAKSQAIDKANAAEDSATGVVNGDADADTDAESGD
jgi:hypothetical protein